MSAPTVAPREIVDEDERPSVLARAYGVTSEPYRERAERVDEEAPCDD